MPANSKSSKEQKQLAVSSAVLEVIEKEGLAGVTHSKVARRSLVSRAWIYEYIGKDKNALIEHAAEVLAAYFTKAGIMELPKSKAELELRAQEGIEFLFTSVELRPVIIKIYFRFRGTANPIGHVIRKYEMRWQKEVEATLASVLGYPEDQASLVAELIMTLRLGFAHRFATSAKPEEARAKADKIFEIIHAVLGNR